MITRSPYAVRRIIAIDTLGLGQRYGYRQGNTVALTEAQADAEGVRVRIAEKNGPAYWVKKDQS